MAVDEEMEGKKFVKKPKNFNKQSAKLYKNKVSKRELFLQEVEQLKKRYDEIDSSTAFKTFEELPLSSETQKGLKQSKFVSLTEIQKVSIVLALKGHDILGAAKTGSGKTLAFIIPVLECLFREGWSRPAGLGALVITPTRELAYQIFNVFKKVGKFHDFTVALVIGGKDHDIERKVFNQFNIVIGTPGRLLEHMHQNPLFDGVNLQMLVLDEADRILDLGFADTMDAIINSLPLERQTLLFSATQTKSVKDLARLSLKDPKYVSVDEHAKYATPESLIQSYVVMEAPDKINFLWSFLRRHTKQKTLVFMATCKQVRYTFEVFCRLRPGISVTALHGGMHQLKRMEKYNSFCRKENVVMFATDIAARGLDFPNVNWVIQLDCPEDVNTYIHRAGRTARYCKGGESVLVLLPSEKDSMLQQMEARRIPITEIQVNPRELSSISKKLTTICTTNQETSECAKRAFVAYLKNIFLMKDKTVFDVQKINTEAYARSLGLLVAPRTRFINKRLKIKAASANNSAISPKKGKSLEFEISDKSMLNTSGNESEDEILESAGVNSTFQLSEVPGESEDFMQIKSQHELYASVESAETDSEGEDEVLQNVSQKGNTMDFDAKWNTTMNLSECTDFIQCSNFYKLGQDSVQESSKKIITKFAAAKKALKSGVRPNVKIVFDEEGESTVGDVKVKAPVIDAPSSEASGGNNASLERMLSIFAEADKKDRETYKKKVREKHRAEKIKLKESKRKRDDGEEDKLPEDDPQDISSKQREDNLKQYIEELPDPDKFFGKDSENESDEDMEESLSERLSNYEDEETVESMSEEEKLLKQKPEKTKKGEIGPSRKKQKLSKALPREKTKKEKIGPSRKKLKLSKALPSTMGSTLALDDDEEFALNLLQGS